MRRGIPHGWLELVLGNPQQRPPQPGGAEILLSIFQSKNDPETRNRFQYKMILKTVQMRRPRSGRVPFVLVLGRGQKENRNRSRLGRPGKWETGLWFSSFPRGASRGGGNVRIWRAAPDSQGAGERVGNLGLVFHSFHGPVISTAGNRSR